MTEPVNTKPAYPARTRLIVAAVVWVVLIRTGLSFAMDALELTPIWRSTISTSLFLAIFIPLSLAAANELSEARKRGDAPPAPPPSRWAVISWAVFTALFWMLTIWATVGTGEYLFPLLPVIGTIWLVVQVRRYRRAQEPTIAADSE
ncbi:hypothetical protein ACX80N_16800 [Arthrobacter sp. MDT2-16]